MIHLATIRLLTDAPFGVRPSLTAPGSHFVLGGT